jgi:hypothetical protein
VVSTLEWMALLLLPSRLRRPLHLMKPLHFHSHPLLYPLAKRKADEEDKMVDYISTLEAPHLTDTPAISQAQFDEQI